MHYENIYCGTIGIEYMHITTADRSRLDTTTYGIKSWRFILYAETKRHILEDLIAADGLEKYLGSKYVDKNVFL